MRGLKEQNVAGALNSSKANKKGRKRTETRVSAADVRATLEDIYPVIESLLSASETLNHNTSPLIVESSEKLKKAVELSKMNSPSMWEQAESLLDQSILALGPEIVSRGTSDPLARRFMTAVNRDSRRRAQHQIAYLYFREIINANQQAALNENIDKIVRASVLRGDKTAIALSVLEKAERACERLGEIEENNEAQQTLARFIRGIAAISGQYLQARMNKNSNLLDIKKRASFESWLATKSHIQTQVAQALSSGLAYSSAEKATRHFMEKGALHAHQRMLVTMFGLQTAKENSAGQWYAVPEESMQQIYTALNMTKGIVRIPGLGFICPLEWVDEAVENWEEKKLSCDLMRAMVSQCMPKSKASKATHPAIVAFSDGLHSGLIENMTAVAVRSSGQTNLNYQNRKSAKWAQIITAAASVASPGQQPSFYRALSNQPETTRLKSLTKAVCEREDSNSQRLVLQVAAKLFKSKKEGLEYENLCYQGWQFAKNKAAERNVLSSQPKRI